MKIEFMLSLTFKNRASYV